ncbi:hypothetical protein WN48_08019 [Eufriesea mexicana]|uniref:Uncharacterized protein n=1 Tax=Eufriesea mexicana TaxID=516756 RepID=A0A310SJH0_9HYME|nr:hypothetical protein WN48_08019 [Eufriesea mexicana]
MGASCAVKGSKSHPCHCCSHLASPGASVQQQQQHHHHRHHHHHHETHHAHHQHHHHHHPAGKQPSGELQPQNNNGDCNILAPLRSKMKVLKKLKRKMGLGLDFVDKFALRRGSKEVEEGNLGSEARFRDGGFRGVQKDPVDAFHELVTCYNHQRLANPMAEDGSEEEVTRRRKQKKEKRSQLPRAGRSLTVLTDWPDVGVRSHPSTHFPLGL